MVAITATNSATPSPQALLVRARLQQARREADQAEANAESLRAQADGAEVDAEKSQDNVRTLSAQSRRTDAGYTYKPNGGKTEVSLKTQEFLVRMYSAASDKFTASGNPLKTNPQAAPVVNAQGQPTGRIVNIRA